MKIRATIYKICYPAAKFYWFIRRPTTQGVRCIVVHEGNVLLIRHSYGSTLRTTVGGGLKQGETPKQAVKREIYEETGMRISVVTEIGTVTHEKEYKKDTIHVFLAKTDTPNLKPCPAEISEAAWYPLENLPKDTSPLFNQFLALAKPYL